MFCNYKNIKSITKFSIIRGNESFSEDNPYVKLSDFFWDTILSPGFFQTFVEKKYIPFKQSREPKENYDFFLQEYSFLLSSLEGVNKSINIYKSTHIPKADEVFFAYRVWTMILSYYNEYYESSCIRISLSQGLEISPVDSLYSFRSLLDDVYHLDNPFIRDMLSPLLEQIFSYSDGNIVYKFDMFWPDEFIQIAFISQIVKKINPSCKIVLDFSNANEQFDFTQWISLIQQNTSLFFGFFDFFIVYRDFGKGFSDILKYLADNTYTPENVVYLSNGKLEFFDIESKELNQEMFQQFMQTNFNPENSIFLAGKKAYLGRFLPYKCYWNNCNFCTINTNNKFMYDRKYSYDFFIDKWVKFIEENHIYHIVFQDEAIPPQVIIKFSRKIIQKGITINYQFRTRYDLLFTKENCLTLFQSGAGYIGLGLESAVDRVNQEIGNKGNNDVSINEKLRIIQYFDRAGVSIHNYCIFGFPGETDQEILTTYKFIISNIQKTNHFTCSPNIFSLMKGSKIFGDRENYNIYVDEKDIQNPFLLSYPFFTNGKERNMKLLKQVSNNIHKAQFLPWIHPQDDSINASDFWCFIDRSSLFYLMKRLYKRNPYYEFIENIDFLLKLEENTLKHMNFEPTPYFQVFMYDMGASIYLFHWVTNQSTSIDEKTLYFLQNYDVTLCIGDNMKNMEVSFQTILGLIKNNFLSRV